MIIKYISNTEYDNFLKNHKYCTITQSSHWAILQQNVQNRGKTYMFVIEENNKIIGSCLLIVHKLDSQEIIGKNPILKLLFKNKTYLYAHRGPVFDDEKTFDKILEECKKIAKNENAIFIRFDPPISLEENKQTFFYKCEDINIIKNRNKWNNFFKSKKFIVSYDQYQPMSSLILDISKSEEEILKQMSQTGRRNIKKANQSNLEYGFIQTSNDDKFNQFIQIMDETTKRDKFYGHNASYYAKILDILGNKEKCARLYYANFNNKMLAGFIITFFGNTATYYYGASSNQHRNLMATFGLHWYVILDMKKNGYKYYDFLGISPFYYEENNKYKIDDEYGTHIFKTEIQAKNYIENIHKFCKITQNKTRFGGYRIDYIASHEYVLNKIVYNIFLILKKVRKYIRKIGLKI